MSFIQLFCDKRTGLGRFHGGGGAYESPFARPRPKPVYTQVVKRRFTPQARDLVVFKRGGSSIPQRLEASAFLVSRLTASTVIFKKCLADDQYGKETDCLIARVLSTGISIELEDKATFAAQTENEYRLNDCQVVLADEGGVSVEGQSEVMQELQQFLSTAVPICDIIHQKMEIWKEYLEWMNHKAVSNGFLLSGLVEKIDEGKISIRLGKDAMEEFCKAKIGDSPLKIYDDEEDDSYDYGERRKYSSIEVVKPRSRVIECKEAKKRGKSRYVVPLNHLGLCEGDACELKYEDIGTIMQVERLQNRVNRLLACDNMRSIESAEWLTNIQLAKHIPESGWLRVDQKNYHNKQLNPEQKKAVEQILNTVDVSFILGPPGTGKTSVIAEAIYQLVRTGKKVLLSSQSNDAIDNALDRLHGDTAVRAVRLGSKIPDDHPFHPDRLAWNQVKGLKKSIHDLVKRIKKYVNCYKGYIPQEDKTLLLLLDMANKKDFEGIKQFLIANPSILTIVQKIAKTGKEKQVSSPWSTAGNLINNASRIFDYDKIEEISEKAKTHRKALLESRKILSSLCELERLYQKSRNDEATDIEIFLSEENDELKNVLIHDSNVFGITCTQNQDKIVDEFLDNLDKKRNIEFDYAIIDEVSKAMLPDILGCLLKAKHVVLIGDHRQLPPVFRADDDDKEIYGADVLYLFKELVTNTIFKKFYDFAPPENKTMLRQQYRMHNEIANIAIAPFYRDTAGQSLLMNGFSDEDADATKAHGITILGKSGNAVITPAHHVYWVDSAPRGEAADRKECFEQRRRGSTSAYNDYEKDIIIKLLQKMDVSAEAETTVGVISFYSDQNKRIRESVKELGFKNLKVDVNTVDKFQGQERNVIIVSLVRSKRDRIPKNNLFFKAYERINVAFSRAQNMLVIVGSTDFCKAQEIVVPPMSSDGDTSRQEDAYVSAEPIYKDIITKIDEIGCLLPAEEVLGA